MSNKRIFSEKESEDIIQSYKNRESMCSIGRRYNVSNMLIKRFLMEVEVFDELRKTFKYNLNHNAFNEKDISDIFYWVGFITADGCVTSEKRKRLIVGVHNKDKDILEKLNKFVETDKPIYFFKNTNHCSTTICSKSIVEELEKYNIVERKTKISKVPKFIKNSDFERHYWRGVVDGDGTLGFGKYSPFLGIVGTEDICNSFKEFCNSIEGFKSKMKVVRKKNEELHSTTVLSRHTLLILDELYRDCDTYLDRKMETYRKIQQEYGNKNWVFHRRLSSGVV